MYIYIYIYNLQHFSHLHLSLKFRIQHLHRLLQYRWLLTFENGDVSVIINDFSGDNRQSPVIGKYR